MNIGEFLYYSGDFKVNSKQFMYINNLHFYNYKIKSSLFWLQVSQYSATKQEQLGRVLRSIVLTSLIAKKQ